jgi:hypothetical protein
MSRPYLGWRSPSVYVIISVVFSSFMVLLVTSYASMIFPRYLPVLQRLSFLLTAGFFMTLFRYSVFENWKIDTAFMSVAFLLTTSLLFADYKVASALDVVILAPLLEEFFFRGYMIGMVLEAVTMEKETVVKVTATITGITVSLCSFVVLHSANEALTAFYYGFLFSSLMVAYRLLRDSVLSEYAVVFPIIPHFLNNFVLYNFNSAMSGIITVTSVIVLMAVWSILAYQRFKRRLFI